MKSMTGYARAEDFIGNRHCLVEIRTVNHRFCDISLKMPKSFSPLEITLKKYLGKKIKRGRVDISIQMGPEGERDIRLVSNLSLAKEYYHLLTELKRELALSENISLSQLLSLKEIISIEKIDEEMQQWDDLRPFIDSALNSLNEMRESEGATLKKDFQERIEILLQHLSGIEARAPQVTDAYREKLLHRLQQLNLPIVVDDSRLLTEVAFFAERSDITEETVRLRSHIQQAMALLDMQIPIGRKLDFILQEMNREINTIGSKANDALISQAVVEIKSELEKMREQTQNVE